MPRVFFSYSHKDEELRDRLETHLAMLKRENIVETWHDRRITAGDEWKGQIDSNLESADVVLLLVSADFLNSYYCYDVELQRALELHNEGKSKVIPVILKHCDWKSAPFSKLQAAPKDGKPIVSWTDLDEAFLNVVQMLRDSLKKVTKNSLADKSNSVDRNTSALTSATNLSTSLNYTTEPRSSNLRVSKAFTEAETDKFIDEAFDYMTRFFDNSLSELRKRNDGIETSFKKIDSNRFTAVIYKNGNAKARCKITLDNGMNRKEIRYSGDDSLDRNGFNESLSVEHDKQAMFLSAMGMPQFTEFSTKNLTFEGAAEYYWQLLIRYLQ